MSVEQWDQRQLCPDGSCIGLIGDAGTCNVCGRAAPNWGEERKRGLKDESGPVVIPATPTDPIEPGAPVAIGKAKDWTQRTLCSDGSCIGVIGADGTCKVCGRAADGTPAPARAGEDDDEYDDDEYDDEDGDEDDGDVADYEDEDGDADEDAELKAAAADLAASLPEVQEAERKLCPDGACIGVVGPDGKCKVCGKEGV